MRLPEIPLLPASRTERRIPATCKLLRYIYRQGSTKRKDGGAVVVLEIIGIVAILLALAVSLVVLPLIGGFLKSLNKSMGGRVSEIKKQVGSSVENIEMANKEIEAIAAATAGVRLGMDKTLKATDKAIAFLDSKAFQLGFPAVLWVFFFVVALPRAIFHQKKKKKKSPLEPIPPPSWQAAAEQTG